MFEVKITGTSLHDLAQNVSALAIQLGAAPSIRTQPDAPAVENKPAPKRAAPKATVAADPADVPPEVAKKANGAAAPVKELSFDEDVGPVVTATVLRVSKEAVIAVLDEFGAARASEIEPAQWPELVARLEALG